MFTEVSVDPVHRDRLPSKENSEASDLIICFNLPNILQMNNNNILTFCDETNLMPWVMPLAALK